jgi:hypothetical protein
VAGDRGERAVVYLFTGYTGTAWKDEKVLEMDGSDGFTR